MLGCGTALLMGLLTGPANAASVPGGCPFAYEAATFDQLLELPQIKAGLADVYDLAHAELRFDQVNHNGDTLICWKSVGNGDQFRSMYTVNLVDNNAAPK